MNITATPDTVIIEPLEDKATIVTGDQDKGRILRGKVLSIGLSLPTPSGATITPNFKRGSIVYFLSYEGGYDVRKIEGKEVYFVKLQDMRGVES